MPLAASISATRGPTPRTYMTGVSKLGTEWMLYSNPIAPQLAQREARGVSRKSISGRRNLVAA